MVRILTDSAADFTPAEAEKLGITVIPLNVTFEDGSVIRDSIDMTPDEYYQALSHCKKLPTTSQPSPALFEHAFAQAAAAGDQVVAILISEKLSGTCQSARLGAEMAGCDNVFVIDSTTATLAQACWCGWPSVCGTRANRPPQIVAAIEQAKKHVHLAAVIDDLNYLRKGGRLPAGVAFAGGMLGVKPLIAVAEGKVKLIGSARGLPGAYVALFKKVEGMGGVNPRFETAAFYTENPREVEPIQTYLTHNLHLPQPHLGQIGCVIAPTRGRGPLRCPSSTRISRCNQDKTRASRTCYDWPKRVENRHAPGGTHFCPQSRDRNSFPLVSPWGQNLALNRALAAKRLAHSQRKISLYVSRPSAHVGWTGLF